MAYLEGISLRSSETFRQWFKKLQCVFPGRFSRNDLKSKRKLLQIDGNVTSDDVFPSQKNLDVIMNTLRRDLVHLLRRSNASNLITILIYKINILDNNIREICSFQSNWTNYPFSSISLLEDREKYLVRLIEEIMDDIFEAYSSQRRTLNHFSFSERNINGIISVLGILKKEVSNMIHVITASIEQHHNTTLFEAICAPPDIIGAQYLNTIDSGKTDYLPIISPFEAKKIDNKKKNKSSQVFLPNNKSYPFIVRNTGRLFSSLENVCCGLAINETKESSDHVNVVRELAPRNNSDLQELSRNFFADDNRTDGRGDGREYCNDGTSFTSIQNSEQLNFKYKSTSGISNNVNKYLRNENKNAKSPLSYNKEHSRPTNIVINRKDSDREEDSPRLNLCERPSRLSWPSVTVIRDIKSEMYLDVSSKYDRLQNDCKGYYSSDEENLSDTDSDNSYISCALDDFQLDTTFLDHVKEKYLPDKLLHKPSDEYAERNNTKGFSCKSPKLSEIFAAPRMIRRQESRLAEVYHSIESLSNVASCFGNISKDDLSRQTMSTEEGIGMKALEYRKDIWQSKLLDKEVLLQDRRTFADSFKTLALAEDCGYDTRYTPSMVSFASVAIGTEDVTNKDNEISSFYSYKSAQQERALKYAQVSNSNLEDSQYSAICLALPPSSIRLFNIGKDVNLLAIEVEQT